MATRPYLELFRIECRHEYFSGGLCPLAQIQPTSRCIRMLERNACLFRTAPGTGSVYSSDPELLKTWDETGPFGFVVTAAADQLVRCTEINSTAPPDTTLWYFSNTTVREDKLLHADGGPFAKALPIVTRPPATRDSATFDMLGNEVRYAEPEGGYSTRMPGGKTYDFYLTSASPARIWGAIEVFPTDGRLSPPPLLPGGADEPGSKEAVFTISLPARRPFWRYYIVSQSPSDRSYEGHQIESAPPRGGKSNGEPTWEFSGSQPRDLNGRPAWVFESKAPIPMCKYPAERGQFVLKGRGGEPPIALPYAQPENVRLERTRDGGAPRACSEIFVYL